MYLLTFANVPRFLSFLIRNVPVFSVFKQACLLHIVKYQKKRKLKNGGNILWECLISQTA